MTAISCAMRGCTCEPDIETRHTSQGAKRWVRHDDDCPAADTGTAYGIVPGAHTDRSVLADAIRQLLDPTGEAP